MVTREVLELQQFSVEEVKMTRIGRLIKQLKLIFRLLREVEIKETPERKITLNFRSLQVTIGEDIEIKGSRDIRIGAAEYLILNTEDEFNPRESTEEEQALLERERVRTEQEKFKRQLTLALLRDD